MLRKSETFDTRRAEEKSASRVAREVHYGLFERTLTIPHGVDGEKISARYEKGVLEVVLPLPTAASPRKVPVQTPDGTRKVAA